MFKTCLICLTSSAAASGSQHSVSDVPGKVSNLLFFVFYLYFFWKWAETFKKLQFFYLCFYLEYFKKLPIKRSKNPKFKQLYLKNQGKFRVKTEILWKFIQISPKEPSFLNTTHADIWQGALSPTTCGATASSSQFSKSQSIFFDVF